MKAKEIEDIAVKAMARFPYKVKRPVILFIDKKEFSRFLDNMNLKKHLGKTPCFVASMKGGDVIYFCEDIVNGLVKGLRRDNKVKFVEGVTLHELYHVYNNIPVGSRSGAIFSEELVHSELDKDFPEIGRFLKKFKSK
tara:strand:- start:310 stop:723 length:414 start_codon:yes stop_codon:yes gene_type:complete